MIGVDRNVDFRYPGGYPSLGKALRDGTRVVRCISLPEMEAQAEIFIQHGIRVIAVYTSESDAQRYVMRACSALQIGNEPGFVYPDGASSWPTGTADDMVNVWSDIANVLVPQAHPEGLPLIGPGIWIQDYAKWSLIANRLPGLSAAACHIYPGPSSQSPGAVRTYTSYFRNVRKDLPLICTEYHLDQRFLEHARQIDYFCDARLWQGYNGATNLGDLEGTPAYGILALTRPR